MSDLIRREDAIKATWQEPTYTDPLNVLTEVRDRIEAIPSADRPQGEWIRTIFTDCGSPIDECSNCGHYINGDMKVRNFCPNCGFRMKGADDELVE